MKTVILRPDTLQYVLDALKEAGVEYVMETPEQARVRELESKLEALRNDFWLIVEGYSE